MSDLEKDLDGMSDEDFKRFLDGDQEPKAENMEEQGTIGQMKINDNDLQSARAMALHQLEQCDAFILLTAHDEIIAGKGIGYNFACHYGKTATSYFLHQFFHNCVSACVNMLGKIDQNVQAGLQKAMMINGFMPHPMDSDRLISRGPDGKLRERPARGK